jgi:hypothetical protein
MIEVIKKNNQLALIIALVALLVVYLLFKVKCFGSCDTTVIKPLFVGILSLLPTLILLLFFSDRVFVSWLKRIAWWIVLVTAILVRSNNHESDFSMFGSDNFVIGVMMTLLFIITLVYVLIMNRRLKKQGV